MRSNGVDRALEFLGEVDLPAKLRMLDSIDVFSVPTAYPEAKGVYLMEALARGVPVVQPAHGSFPELLRMTGGGVLVPPGDSLTLANALADLLRDAPRRKLLGERGRAAVESTFTEKMMAENMLKVFSEVMGPAPTTVGAQ
jgi:glycosyltransferase involved in cell wall biosynthesis